MQPSSALSSVLPSDVDAFLSMALHLHTSATQNHCTSGQMGLFLLTATVVTPDESPRDCYVPTSHSAMPTVC
jgi:hypothetical protein